MIAQSNVTHMLVGKDLDLLAATGTRSDLAVGQIGVFLVGSKTAKVTALANGDRFSIAYRNSKGVVVETPVMTFGDVSKKYAVEYTAPTQSSVALGYNGTSGSIDAINSNDYVAHIFWKDNSTTFAHGTPVKFGAYRSSAAATQAEVAFGLAASFAKQFSREIPKILKAEVLSSAAGAPLDTGVDTITFKTGSKIFTATDIDSAVANDALAVGDYIRIGTAVTDPVYKIESLNAVTNSGSISMPFQGEDIADVDTAFEVITATAAAAADFGVTITGLPTTSNFNPGIIRYDVTVFDIELKDDFGATTVTKLSTASRGSGTYEEVAQNEWFLKGNRGEPWRLGNYPTTVTLEATSGKTYDYVTFAYADYNAQTLDRKVGSFGNVMIATEDAVTGDVHADLKTVLGIS